MSKKNSSNNRSDEDDDTIVEEVTVEDIPATGADEGEEEEQISRVREILFGSKSRQLEGSLNELESKMRAEHSLIRKEFHERFDSLESYLKGEVQALLEQLEREGTTREDSVSKLQDKLAETGEELSKKASELHKRMDESERKLRDEILQARQRLTDDLQERTQDLSDKLHEESKHLRKGKADRSTMAALLTDMASRLNSDEEEH